MKVLLLNGSPHANGCTRAALAEVERALQAEGVETECLHVAAKPVRGCIGCGGCAKTHRCVFGDDAVNACIGALAQADGLVVGSPVYYASPNGTVLSLLDRVFYAGGCYAAHKPAAAVVSARRGGTTAALDVLTKYFTISQMPVVSSTYWPMVHGNRPEETAADLEGLQTMRNLGRNMAYLLRCIEAGRQAGVRAPEAERACRTNFIR